MAAMRRAFTRSAERPPTRSISPESRTRSIFGCSAGGSSPISSRKIVPPSPCWNLPRRFSRAPVKAPFAWPNSSLSNRVSGMAAQFTVTSGRSRRALCSWMARATSSFPVPFSPTRRMPASVGATRAIVSARRRIGGEVPSSRPPSPDSSASRRFSSSRRVRRRAFDTASRMRSTAGGFSMKSRAPSLTARTAVSIVPWAVRTRDGTLRLRTASFSRRPIPSRTGI